MCTQPWEQQGSKLGSRDGGKLDEWNERLREKEYNFRMTYDG